MTDDLKQALEHIRALIQIAGHSTTRTDRDIANQDAAASFLTRLSSVQEVEPAQAVEAGEIATVELTSAGPKLKIHGIAARWWLGCFYDADAKNVAALSGE